MEITPFARHVLLAVASVATLAACGAPSGGGPGGSGVEGTLACERDGYPCSLAEVPQDVRDASWDALEGAYDSLRDGSMSDVVASLEARSDVVELAYDDLFLRFRLDGGAPTFLYDVTGLSPAVEPSITETNVASSGTLVPSEVVGRDRNGDGSVDNRDSKHALVLAPYKWQVATWDYGDQLASNLGSLPPYGGNVDYVENPTAGSQNLSLDDWRSWYQYDFVYVTTHGRRLVAKGTTYVLISSGVEADRSEALPYVGAYAIGTVDRDAGQTNRVIEYGLAADFFERTYGDGLDDAIVVFSACETGAEGASVLADAIGGRDFVMFGWSEVVRADDAAFAARALLEYLGRGLRSEEAMARLAKDGLTVGTGRPRADGSFRPAPIFTRYAPSGGDQRLLDVPTLLDEARDPLQDGTDLRGSLAGSAGDGEPDVLTVTTVLAGIEAGTESDYELRFELDGTATPQRYGVTSANRLDDATLQLELDVDLGRDAPTDPVDLMAILALPEGGESRYVAEVTLGRACGWTMSFSGPDDSGFYERSFGSVVLDQQPTIVLQGASDELALPGVTIQTFESLPEEVPTTLALGLSGSALGDPDGGLSVTFDDVAYASGDGGPCCTVTNPVDTFPPPVAFELTVNEPDRIEGTLTGEVWAFAEDGGTPLRKADLRVDFAVTNDDACRVVDPTDPL